MFYDNLPKDKNGFIVLDDILDKVPMRHKETQIDGHKYFFKMFHGSDNDVRDKKALAYGREFAINEIVNEIIAKKFGFGTPDYKLVKYGNLIGVVSTSLEEKYGNATTLQNLRHDLNFMGFDHCLRFYNEEKKRGNLSNMLYDRLQMASLFGIGLGLYDNHSGNIVVTLDPKDSSKDMISLIDQEKSWGSYYKTKKRLQDALQLSSKLRNKLCKDWELNTGLDLMYTKLSIGKTFQDLFDYYKDIRYCDVISGEIIKEYLDIMTNLLTNDGIFREINESVEEEYGLKPPKAYMDKLKLVMIDTAKHIESSFEQREVEM